MYPEIFFVLLGGYLLVVGVRSQSNDTVGINCFPRDVDPCRHLSPAMYYDVAWGQCIPLQDGVCRFDHHFGDAPFHCGFPPAKGPCKGKFKRWYYNPQLETCRKFDYGGCESNGTAAETNENRFRTYVRCRLACRNFDFRSSYRDTPSLDIPSLIRGALNI